MILVKKVAPSFVDVRGAIAMIVENPEVRIRSVLLITSRAGSIRANHYHKKDSHYVYMLEGEMEYTEKSMNGNNREGGTVVLVPGDMVYTRPMMAHAMRFLKDSTFLALTSETRVQSAYEEDTVRIQLIK